MQTADGGFHARQQCGANLPLAICVTRISRRSDWPPAARAPGTTKIPERTAGPDEEEFAEREYQGEDTVDPSGSGID